MPKFRYPAREYIQSLIDEEKSPNQATPNEPDPKQAFIRLVDFIKNKEKTKNPKAAKASRVTKAYLETAETSPLLKKGLQVKKAA